MNPLLYLLLALTAVLAATANTEAPVLDINGDPIFGGSYYVLPAISGSAGGGLALVPLHSGRCPLYIGQESSEVERGIPVKFSNWKSKVGYVPESANLNIKMDVNATYCQDDDESTYWMFDAFILPLEGMYIRAARKSEPGGRPWLSFFQIKKTGEFHNGYNIALCPKEGETCLSVGISAEDDGFRRLNFGPNPPFPFVFMKASEKETSSKTVSII